MSYQFADDLWRDCRYLGLIEAKTDLVTMKYTHVADWNADHQAKLDRIFGQLDAIESEAAKESLDALEAVVVLHEAFAERITEAVAYCTP